MDKEEQADECEEIEPKGYTAEYPMLYLIPLITVLAVIPSHCCMNVM